jgi:hypothetical protein
MSTDSFVRGPDVGTSRFLTGMLPTQGRDAAFIGRVGAELDIDARRKAAHLAALNVLAVARQHLGSLDKGTRIVRLGVMVATSGDIRHQPKVADASDLLQVFGKDKNPSTASSLPPARPNSVIFEYPLIAPWRHKRLLGARDRNP